VITEARRYRAAIEMWEARTRDDLVASVLLWRKVREAEEALFAVLDALDEEGAGGGGETAVPPDDGVCNLRRGVVRKRVFSLQGLIDDW
jgi:hypothetical protein